MSFVKLIRKTLLLSEDAQEYSRRLKSVSNIEFFENEKRRIEEISSMDTRQALRELMRDTDDENALGYYNKIRNKDLNEKKGKNLYNGVGQAEYTCKWTGSSKSLAELRCSNLSVVHPWKQNEDICGYKTSMQTYFCFYHQKYCLDPEHIHESTNVRILIHNELGLCNKCYILKTGSPPLKLQRLPGLYHNTEFTSEVELGIKSHHDNRKIKEDASNSLIDHRTIPGKRKITVLDALSVLKTSWRKRKTNLSDELLEHFRHKRRDSAAMKIQISWKYYRLKTVIQSRSKEVVPNIESSLASHSIESLSIEQISSPISALLCLECSPEIDRLHVKQARNVKREFHRIFAPKRRSKCTLSACEVCFKGRRRQLDGRTSLISFQYDHSTGFSKEDWVNLEDKFKHYDREVNVGSIPQHDFFKILEPLWREITGQRILTDAKNSISNNFSLRDGRNEIDYMRFLSFARRQRTYCVIHSRLVCMDDRCITLGVYPDNYRCTGFYPDPKRSQFCLCGSHKFKHPAKPLDPLYITQKRGIALISDNDLMRVLNRNLLHNGSMSQIELKSFKDATRRLGVKSKAKLSRISYKGSVTVKDTSQVEEDPSQSFVALDSSPETTDVMQPDIPAPDNHINFERLYSVERLENMLSKCVKKTRKQSVIPKPTIPCPICHMGFFDKNLLEAHLVRRHGADEIKFALDRFVETINGEELHRSTKVDWVGSYRCVPPFEPLIPLKICQNHVPPHPRCTQCQNFKKKTPLYPPLRFYESAYVEICGKDEVSRSYHLDTHDKTCKVQVLDHAVKVQLRKLVAICEDGHTIPFVGVCRDENDLGTQVETVSPETNLEMKVEWFPMSSVVGIRYD